MSKPQFPIDSRFTLTLLLFLSPLILSAQSTPATHPKLPFTISKETTAITEPLLLDGTPDYIAALNARTSQGVTPENNGLALFLRVIGEQYFRPEVRTKAFQMLGIETPSDLTVLLQSDEAFAKTHNLSNEVLDKMGTDLGICRLKLWHAEDFPQIAANLQFQKKALDLAVQAIQRPRWWCPYLSVNGSSDYSSMAYPSVFPLRNVADLLSARATLAAATGGKDNFDAFLRDALAIKLLGHHVASGGTLLEMQMGYLIDGRANTAIGVALGAGILSAAQCDALFQAIASLPPTREVFNGIETELLWTSLNNAMLTARGKIDVLKSDKTLFNMLSSIDATAVDWDIALKEIQTTARNIQEFFYKSSLSTLNERVPSIRTILDAWKDVPATDLKSLAKASDESRSNYSRRVGQSIAAYQGGYGAAENARRRAHLSDDLLTLLLAAGKARATTGDWPDTAESLIPKYLKELPLDPYSPTEKDPLKYLVNIKNARVYSVGPDHIDDLGENNSQTKKDDIHIGQ